MKVTNSDIAALTGAGQAAPTTSSTAAARARVAAGQNSSDHVQLSSLSGHLKGLTAEGRRTHLDSLEATVASGQYQADSSAISAKMIEHSMRSSAPA